MDIIYNKIGKVLSGKHSGNFCKIECFNQDDFLIIFLDKDMKEIESQYIENIEKLKKLDLQIKFPNKYEEITNETILNDFYDVYGKTDINQYSKTTQKRIKNLFVLIEDEQIKSMIQVILKENVYVDFTMIDFLCRYLIEHKNFNDLSTKHKNIIEELLKI